MKTKVIFLLALVCGMIAIFTHQRGLKVVQAEAAAEVKEVKAELKSAARKVVKALEREVERICPRCKERENVDTREKMTVVTASGSWYTGVIDENTSASHLTVKIGTSKAYIIYWIEWDSIDYVEVAGKRLTGPQLKEVLP